MALPSEWLNEAFIDDEWAEVLEQVQGRQFLRSGITPTLQRVELKMLLANRDGKRSDISFAGQVVEIKPEPTNFYPMAHEHDQEGSLVLSEIFGHFMAPNTHSTEEMTYKACDCGDSDCEKGYLFMSRKRWERKNATRTEGADMLVGFVREKLGALHGPEVVCEGRLHFDHDGKCWYHDSMMLLFIHLLNDLILCLRSPPWL